MAADVSGSASHLDRYQDTSPKEIRQLARCRARKKCRSPHAKPNGAPSHNAQKRLLGRTGIFADVARVSRDKGNVRFVCVPRLEIISYHPNVVGEGLVTVS